MTQHQIIATKLDGKMWYTTQRRYVGFLFRCPWLDILPAYQPSYEDAKVLTQLPRDPLFKRLRRWLAPSCPDCGGKALITGSEIIGTWDFNVYTCERCHKKWV